MMAGQASLAEDLTAVGAFLTATTVFFGAAIAAVRAFRRARGERAELKRQVTPNGHNEGKTLAKVTAESGDKLDQISATLEASGRLLEVVAGQVHDQSKRLDSQGREIGEVSKRLGAVEANTIAIATGVETAKEQGGSSE